MPKTALEKQDVESVAGFGERKESYRRRMHMHVRRRSDEMQPITTNSVSHITTSGPHLHVNRFTGFRAQKVDRALSDTGLVAMGLRKNDVLVLDDALRDGHLNCALPPFPTLAMQLRRCRALSKSHVCKQKTIPTVHGLLLAFM